MGLGAMAGLVPGLAVPASGAGNAAGLNGISPARVGAGAPGTAGAGPSSAAGALGMSLPLIKPERLKPGDTVAVVNPAGALYSSTDIQVVVERLEALGLKVKTGKYVLARHAYFAGTDLQRAEDLNRMIRDTSVKAIVATRGGWGCARILHLVDYDFLRQNPKIIVGYSDVTALLNAVHAKTGLVTYHGPVGMSPFTEFTADHFRRVLFDGEALTMQNPVRVGNDLTHTGDRVATLTPGVARGRLLGGNLTVLTSILGSGYVPDYNGCLLFTEDVGEELYRVDRMLTQLGLNGILKNMNGMVFGRCTRCDPGTGYASFTIEELIRQHTALHNVPVWYGSMIGHIPDMFTIPLGIEAEINATTGTLTLLESPVA
jgi:muramoyltetrapeptide carboxypeptidase